MKYTLTPKTEKKEPPALELRGAGFTIPVIRIHCCELDAIRASLQQHLTTGIQFFKNAPVVIDFEPLTGQVGTLNLTELLQLLRHYHLIPIGIRNGGPGRTEQAISAGLAIMQSGNKQDFVLQKPAPPLPAEPPPIDPPMIVNHPVRSGQHVQALNGDLVLLAAVNPGAEVSASGNIHVYAPLRGRAMAGVNGAESSYIFTQSLEAELIAIAGHHQTLEFPETIAAYGKAARIYLNDGHLAIEAW